MIILIPIGVAAMLGLFIATINIRFYRERTLMTSEQLREDDEEIRCYHSNLVNNHERHLKSALSSTKPSSTTPLPAIARPGCRRPWPPCAQRN